MNSDHGPPRRGGHYMRRPTGQHAHGSENGENGRKSLGIGRGKSDDSQLEPLMRSDRMYLDLGGGITHMLTEARYFRRENDWRDRDFLEPSLNYCRFLLPPSEILDQPEAGLCSRYLHTSINRIRHPVCAVKWSPEGRRLITGSQNGEFTLWSAFGFISDSSISGHENAAIRCMTWSKNQDWLVSGDQHGALKVWTPQLRPVKVLESEKFTGELQGLAHTKEVRGLSFSPSDLKLCSGGDDLKVKIWDFETGREEKVLEGHGFDVKSVAWHPEKSLILSGGRDNVCKLWNPRTGKELNTLTGHKNTVNFVSWNPLNGNWFVSTSRDKTVRIYDLRMMREKDPCMHILSDHGAEVYAAAWHPMYESVLATGGYDGSLLFWIMSGPKSKPYVQANVPAAHEGAIWSMDWHPAGHLLCTGSNDRTCKFWSRMRPGSEETDLYRGYLRDLSEYDILKSVGRAPPPVPLIDHHKEQEFQRQVIYRKRNISSLSFYKDEIKKRKTQERETISALENKDIPALGIVGKANSLNQAGMLLTPANESVAQGIRYTADPSSVSLSQLLISLVNQKNPLEAINKPRITGPGETSSSRGAPAVQGVQLQRTGQLSYVSTGPTSNRTQAAPQPKIDPTNLPGPRRTGFVRMYDEKKGYGFIRPHVPDIPDLFTHSSDIENGFGHGGEQKLVKGDIVIFRAEAGENKHTGKEQYKAKNIVLSIHDPESAKTIPANPLQQIQAQEQQKQQAKSRANLSPELIQLLLSQANNPEVLAATLQQHGVGIDELQHLLMQEQQQYSQQQEPQPPMQQQGQYSQIRQPPQHPPQYQQPMAPPPPGMAPPPPGMGMAPLPPMVPLPPLANQQQQQWPPPPGPPS